MTDLITFRKTLHQYPELAGQERETARRIYAALQRLNPTKIINNIGGHGILAIFDTAREGKSILFRADLDAFPIQETNSFEHASKLEGISHKCGHDGHSTILLGLAQRLYQHPFDHGRVMLLFQPAEETGEGAKAILEDPKFKEISVDYTFALHNIPGYPQGQIIFRTGAFNPAVISLIIRLEGKQSHAAEQEKGINPDLAIANLLQQIKAHHLNDLADKDFCNITTVHISLGAKDYGTSAGRGELHYTIRCWTKEKLEALKNQISSIVKSTSTEYSLEFSIEWLHYFAASNNAKEAVGLVEMTAKKLNYDYLEKPFPFKWGEDFGLFTEKFKGAMFGLGAGEQTPALHQADYDFPDEIIPYGINMFYGIAANILK